MRVSGRRVSASRRASQIANRLSIPQQDPDAPHQSAPSRPIPIVTTDAEPPPSQDIDVSRSSHKDDLPPEPPAKELQFTPRFKGAAEMEARRKLRMLARRGNASTNPKHASDANKHLNPEISSSEDSDTSPEDDDNDDESDRVDRPDDMDEGDEFDPYAPLYPPCPRIPDSRTVTLLLHAPPVLVLTAPLT